ncbi:MAG TPA: hypothetical protein RMH85_09670 [Polyangiaceae bacterium LLY-WYZ-15_(1-7)]|nr:hypothetical protein [Myxococcales bacterium]MAT25867.1 hypothetical protein [Sandaracinus sp.]HJK89767.1 hypothetical protein [Polyangiaceae bacterium LLY-WYZ-15_(1-7)]MBJ74338.1 hypothetical protein [Sandaracinus sp.]HJL04899.1 hypothetical protein [Polyangiaceae bacterium LLY-WYZ-15_(1-7)]
MLVRAPLRQLAAIILALGLLAAAPAASAQPPEDAFPRRAQLSLDREARLDAPRWLTWTGLAITAGLGTVTVWSLVQTFEARDHLDRVPSAANENELDRFARRSWLLAASTATVAISTFLVAVLGTRWDEGEMQAWAAPNGGGLRLQRVF